MAISLWKRAHPCRSTVAAALFVVLVAQQVAEGDVWVPRRHDFSTDHQPPSRSSRRCRCSAISLRSASVSRTTATALPRTSTPTGVQCAAVLASRQSASTRTPAVARAAPGPTSRLQPVDVFRRNPVLMPSHNVMCHDSAGSLTIKAPLDAAEASTTSVSRRAKADSLPRSRAKPMPTLAGTRRALYPRIAPASTPYRSMGKRIIGDVADSRSPSSETFHSSNRLFTGK